MAKHKEIYRVKLKEFKNGLRFRTIKKDFNTWEEAETYYNELLLDDKDDIVLFKLAKIDILTQQH